jgi:transposase
LAATITKATGRKGCPNYPADYKLRVAKAACEPDISVAKLARAHGLNANMVFKWRRQLRAGLLGLDASIAKPELLAVTMISEAAPPAAPTAAASAAASAIEIEISGARVRVIGMVDPMQLRLVLRCLLPA